MGLSQSIVDANLSRERGQRQCRGLSKREKKNAVFILGSIGNFFHIFVLPEVLYPTSGLIVKQRIGWRRVAWSCRLLC